MTSTAAKKARTAKTSGPRVVTYSRISQDTASQGKGVARQDEGSREFIASRGWTIAAEYSDNDISAFNGKHRPGYEQLMADVVDGKIDIIVLYQSSRLWRNRVERAKAFEVFEQHGVEVVSTQGASLEFRTAQGRMLAGVMTEFDTAESEFKSERIRAAAAQRRAEGRTNGPPLYGWERRYQFDEAGQRVGVLGDVGDQHTADIVREIVDRLLAGESLAGIARDLTERGEPTPYQGQKNRHDGERPGKWAASTVRKLAIRPQNVGIMMHGRKPAGKGSWPAIVDEGKHLQVCALLSDRGRMTNNGAHARRHLLTGSIGECGVCGGVLRVHKVGGNQLYACQERQCVGRRQAWVDELAEAVVLERLRRDDALAAIADGERAADLGPITDKIAELQARLDAAADQYAEGRLSVEMLARITPKIEEELAQAQQQLSKAIGHNQKPALSLDAKAVAGRWGGLSVDAKRDVMRALGMRVKIMRTQRRGPGFRPEEIEISWGTP